MNPIGIRMIFLLLGAMGVARPAAAEEPADTAELPVIVVTAQRVPQDEREVPLSIATVVGGDIEKAKLDTPDDVSRRAANVYFDRDRLYIRGIGSLATAESGLESSVGVFIDGVYHGRATAAMMPLLDVAQVEMIRGPQGALLGKNTIAGALSITTASPQDTWGGYLQGSVGGLDERSVRGAVSIPIADDWGLRLAAMEDRRDGHLRNTTLDRDELSRRLRGGRAKLAWRPEGDLSASLTVERGEQRYDSFGNQLSAAPAPYLALYRVYDPATEADRTNERTAFDLEEDGDTRKGTAVTLRADHALDDATVTSLSSYAKADYDGGADADFSPIPLISLFFDERYRHWSQEIRVTGTLGSIEYVVGVYGLSADVDHPYGVGLLPDGTAGLLAGQPVVPETLAQILSQLSVDVASADVVTDGVDFLSQEERTHLDAFGQASWAPTDSWLLTAGLRRTWERNRGHNVATYRGAGVLPRALLAQEEYDVRGTRREVEWSPRFAVQYAWTPEVTVYASFAHGFKGGGHSVQAPTPDDIEFGPERSHTVELGAKTLLLSSRLAVNFDVFHTNYEDLQVTNFDGTKFVTQNAAEARIDGAEMDLRWRISRDLGFTASVGYLDARYTSFPNAPPTAEFGDVGPVAGEVQDLNGEPLMRAPDWSGALALEYGVTDVAWGLSLGATIETSYRDRMELQLDVDPLDRQPATWQLDARLQLIHAHSGITLRLIGRNLTNETIVTDSNDVPVLGGAHWARVDVGRTWVACLGYDW
ncbi:MAG TPA: TonB-dependent receptor [Nevskiaceae bacterium]|nr:TonB-dependent receptor [Nevskiaceae bacterium]